MLGVGIITGAYFAKGMPNYQGKLEYIPRKNGTGCKLFWDSSIPVTPDIVHDGIHVNCP